MLERDAFSNEYKSWYFLMCLWRMRVLAELIWQINFTVMYVHILLFYNIWLLRYFFIKIFLHVDETEISCTIFLSIVFFWVSLGMLMIFLISALYYACNMLRPLLVKSLFMVTCVLNFWMQDVVIISLFSTKFTVELNLLTVALECLN